MNPHPSKRLSYKFQRLRERLRQAILSGELTGKLPGERQLAQRFNANAKTLSKALTDLAAEGLLERTIGRGTFVRDPAGSGAAAARGRAQRWLLICDPGREYDPLLTLLRNAAPEAHLAADVTNMRPSFLNQFTAVVDVSRGAPTEFLRDLVVRGIPVIVAGREPQAFSMHCVVADVMLGASCAGRDLMTAGHRRFAAVDASGSNTVEYALTQTARRFGLDITVERRADDEVQAAIEAGTTAFVCDGEAAATRVIQTIRKMGLGVPDDVSVAAVGCTAGEPPCTGYFVPPAAMADAILGLLRDDPKRPTTLWLVGAPIDRCTTTAHLLSTPDQAELPLPRLAL